MNSAPLTVGILGLGNIAQGWDQPTGPAVTTHIKACLQDPRLHIAWIADPKADVAAIKKAWGLAADIVTPEALITKAPDILCIASPDHTHGDLVRAALKTPPRLILCEKPLALDLAAARNLIANATATNVPLVVNFMRRWLPGVSEWVSQARAGAFGKPVGVTCVYFRGLRHNACHWLDLIGALFGADAIDLHIDSGGIRDFSAADPTVSATFKIRVGDAAVPIALNGVDFAKNRTFSADMRFEKSTLEIATTNGGIDVRYSGLRPASADESYDPQRFMAYVWRNLADHLLNGAALRSVAADTLDGMMLVEAVAAKINRIS